MPSIWANSHTPLTWFVFFFIWGSPSQHVLATKISPIFHQLASWFPKAKISNEFTARSVALMRSLVFNLLSSETNEDFGAAGWGNSNDAELPGPCGFALLLQDEGYSIIIITIQIDRLFSPLSRLSGTDSRSCFFVRASLARVRAEVAHDATNALAQGWSQFYPLSDRWKITIFER